MVSFGIDQSSPSYKRFASLLCCTLIVVIEGLNQNCLEMLTYVAWNYILRF
jgi:hypothetical protein